MDSFFHMGGYAFFVWTAYVFAAVVIVINVGGAYVRERNLMSQLIKRLRREQRS